MGERQSTHRARKGNPGKEKGVGGRGEVGDNEDFTLTTPGYFLDMTWPWGANIDSRGVMETIQDGAERYIGTRQNMMLRPKSGMNSSSYLVFSGGTRRLFNRNTVSVAQSLPAWPAHARKSG